jgi:hypothetical protein
MSELERFRDHAAEMAAAEHKPECRGHLPSRWGWAREIHPDPSCAGCITEADRALWARLAAEIDDYLTDDDAPLWEDA